MPSALTEAHYAAFGRIVYWYGNCEVGFRFCIGGMLKSHWPHALLATSTITATNLANTVKSLAPDTLDEVASGQLIGLTNRWLGYNKIRMQVAHHRWRATERQGAIRPTYYDVRTGKAKLLGFEEDERDFTSEELDEISYDLARINEEIKDFIHNQGFYPDSLSRSERQAIRDK